MKWRLQPPLHLLNVFDQEGLIIYGHSFNARMNRWEVTLLRLNAAIRLLDKEILVSLCKWQQCLWLLGKSFSAPFPEKCRCYHLCKAKQTSLLLREGKLFLKGSKCYWPSRKESMFMQIFIPLRLFALQGRYMSKVCSVRKSSGPPLPIFGGKSFCLSFPWRQSGTNFFYCLRQLVLVRQVACLWLEETLP